MPENNRTTRPVLTVPTPEAAQWNAALRATLTHNRMTVQLAGTEILVANALRDAGAEPIHAVAAIRALREA